MDKSVQIDIFIDNAPTSAMDVIIGRAALAGRLVT